MIRTIALSALILSLSAAPALAGDAPLRTAEDEAPAILELPEVQPERLSRRDRWRGTPYVRAENQQLRRQALDKSVPLPDAGFGRGTVFGLESEQIRAEALDKTLPIQVPGFANGFGGGL